MITCYLRSIVDPLKLAEFEQYARPWIALVERFGGKHHGYFIFFRPMFKSRTGCAAGTNRRRPCERIKRP